MIFKNLCVLVLWTKVASALEGLKSECKIASCSMFNNSVFRLCPFTFQMGGHQEMCPCALKENHLSFGRVRTRDGDR